VHNTSRVSTYLKLHVLLDSGTWKWICSLKDLALANMKKKLGRGDTIFLFYDNWLSGNGGALVTRFPDIRIPTRMQNWKLSAIIERSNWILKDPLLLPMWDNITQQSIPNTESNDSWIWTGAGKDTGNFCLSLAWDLVRTHEAQYQFSEVIWFPFQGPKMAICLLRALQSKLFTRDYLKSLGIIDADMCVLYKVNQGSIHHLFFECPFSAYIWSPCKLKLGLAGSPIGSIYDEALLIQSKFKAKAKSTILAKLILVAAVWHVWKERNLRVFQLQEQYKIMAFRKLYEDFKLLLRTCNWKSDRKRDMVVILSNRDV